MGLLRSRTPPHWAAVAAVVTLAASASLAAAAPATGFGANPIVYFAVTDRFFNGNPDNDHSYGRGPDDAGEIGTFHGGDLAGLTLKLREGYFTALGVNALWITAPYEQIHGWVVGGKQSFRHYAWWGRDWVRAGLPGYTEGGSDDYTMQLAYLADFRTESTQAVGLPPLLRHKPDTLARALPATTVRGYLVSWLSDWVREFGVDGFRCDTVKHVEPASWLALRAASTAALADWKRRHPAQKIDHAPFWMTGEAWGQGPERSAWHDAGFDSMLNVDFQDAAEGDWAALDTLYRRYAGFFMAMKAPARPAPRPTATRSKPPVRT